MSAVLEGAIRDLLISEDSTEQVAQAVLQKLSTNTLNLNDQNTYMNFLIHAGYYGEILSLYESWFKDKKPCNLVPFCFVLHKSGFKPGADFLKNFFKAIENYGAEISFSNFMPWDSLDTKFDELKSLNMNRIRQNAIAYKASQFDKLEYLRTNRMIEEEEKLLNILVAAYPEDPTLVEDKKNFKQRWARAIIARKSIEAFDESAESTQAMFSTEALTCAEAIVKEMKNRANKKPYLAYNFAIALYFLELYENAREILNLAPVSLSADWFMIELLIKGRRHIECLDALAHIENKYADDPETSFGVIYYRALALNGLGQINTALELIRSIVSIRPNYRSAHSLMMKWGGR